MAKSKKEEEWSLWGNSSKEKLMRILLIAFVIFLLENFVFYVFPIFTVTFFEWTFSLFLTVIVSLILFVFLLVAKRKSSPEKLEPHLDFQKARHQKYLHYLSILGVISFGLIVGNKGLTDYLSGVSVVFNLFGKQVPVGILLGGTIGLFGFLYLRNCIEEVEKKIKETEKKK